MTTFDRTESALATQPVRSTADAAELRRRAKGENFTVASRLLPARHRRHLVALYAFARVVDDIGDEAPGNRLVLLDKVARDIDHLFAGHCPAHPLYRQLADTVRDCDLPQLPFDQLIEANRQDQRVHRYRTYRQLLDYCVLSANPVGRLVLGVFGAATPERIAQSDQICTALQLLEHWQDVAEDLDRGRIYLPAEDLDRFEVTETDLRSPCAARDIRALMAFQTQRALRLLEQGSALVDTVHGAARFAIAGYLAGGRATAEAIAEANFDVLAVRPRPRRLRAAAEWVSILGGGGGR